MIKFMRKLIQMFDRCYPEQYERLSVLIYLVTFLLLWFGFIYFGLKYGGQ